MISRGMAGIKPARMRLRSRVPVGESGLYSNTDGRIIFEKFICR